MGSNLTAGKIRLRPAQQRALLKSAPCETRFDSLTRQLYATDASIYQIEPLGVAFPRNAAEASLIMRAAADSGLEIIPRGAGTGLAGGAVGSGLVIDFSRHNRAIVDFDPERRRVRVGAGVVLDALNAYLKPYGLCFGPDVATSSRATLGGMIANNSSGAHVPVYGVTSDHVVSLEVILADGRIERIGAEHGALSEARVKIDRIIHDCAGIVRSAFHEEMIKRWHGYGLDRYLRHPGDLTQLVAGSEGTLVAIVSAELDLTPLPRKKSLGLLFFASVAEAMQATVELLDLEPAAIEHIDRTLFDQTRGQRAFKAARALLELDDKPCESILIVEFFEDDGSRLAAFSQRNLGLRRLIVEDAAEMELVWSLRKAGLSLLTGCKGAAKPTAGIEDVAVRPRDLPEYVAGLQRALNDLGLAGSFYGHAASGLLHVRPVVDLHRTEDIAKYRKLGEEVAALAKQFKGSIAAEHGVGIGRTEFLSSVIPGELLDAMAGIKRVFDPDGRMNPGKIIDTGRYRFDQNLRLGAGHGIELSFQPVLAFAAKDESFVANLEQCNGCGGCRKASPTMCPTYLATGDEIMSTRGRANTIRAVLEGRIEDDEPGVLSAALDEALSNCLACKACTTECPSNVNMALLKAELLFARQRKRGLTLAERVFSNVDLLGRLGCLVPRIANASLHWSWLRKGMRHWIGISEKRPLPSYAMRRFDRWFAKRRPAGTGARGRVILWDDTFVRYHEPNIGQAAVKVLEAAGFEVTLPEGRACCGRPAFSVGRLDMARRLGAHNLELLANGDAPVLFLEPSCYSMFAEDYRELGVESASAVASRCALFEEFLERLLEREPDALHFEAGEMNIAIHAHCHTKALAEPRASARLLQRLPGSHVRMLDTGCCGMAGAFGALDAKYDLSLKVAAPLVQQVQELAAGARVVAPGTSCRHQIERLTSAHPVHIAELLAERIRER